MANSMSKWSENPNNCRCDFENEEFQILSLYPHTAPHKTQSGVHYKRSSQAICALAIKSTLCISTLYAHASVLWLLHIHISVQWAYTMHKRRKRVKYFASEALFLQIAVRAVAYLAVSGIWFLCQHWPMDLLSFPDNWSSYIVHIGSEIQFKYQIDASLILILL